MKKNKNIFAKNKLYAFLIIFGLTGCFFVAFLHLANNPRIVFAESGSEEELQEELDEKQEDLESLEQKARNYRKMIDLKKKQQDTLENQLEVMEVHEENIENNIAITKKEIDNKQDKIKNLKEDINKKQQEIEKSKEGLAEMIRSYYKIEKEINLAILSSKGNLADIFNHSEYLNQASQEVEKSLENIKEKKEKLTEEKNKLEQEKNDLDNKKDELEEEVSYLENEQNKKEALLNRTEGEEAKYQELLSRVEKQKRELIGDISSLSDEIQGELSNIQSRANKPKDGLASTSWYYSQKDSRWAYNRIGLSSSLMKDYGCAISAVAMVFTYHGENITPGKLAGKPIFYRDLIVWPDYWKGVSLESSTYHGNVSWSRIDDEIEDGNPVIVFVRGRGAAGHYVVIHSKNKNDYIVHDPLFGANIYLSTTQKLVGAIYKSSTDIDQMIIYED